MNLSCFFFFQEALCPAISVPPLLLSRLFRVFLKLSRSVILYPRGFSPHDPNLSIGPFKTRLGQDASHHHLAEGTCYLPALDSVILLPRHDSQIRDLHTTPPSLLTHEAPPSAATFLVTGCPHLKLLFNPIYPPVSRSLTMPLPATA